MRIVTLHTPKQVYQVDIDFITPDVIAKLKADWPDVTPAKLQNLYSDDLRAEISGIKERLDNAGIP